MEIRLAERATRLKPSATIAAAQKARELRSQGVHVYDFTLGEPDFTTPRHICEAAEAAIRAGRTHYTPSSGIPELRQAVARRYAERGIGYAPNEIVISNGAKHALHNVLSVLCQQGDEVIIPAPYWVSYSALVELTGATPVIVQTDETTGFKLLPEQLKQALTARTRVLMLNSPCNPTGALYTEEELKELGKVLQNTDVLILSDEIYEDLVYGRPPVPPLASLSPDLRERTVTVSGVSKSFAMTGWRIGWSAAPREITAAIEKLQSQQTSNPCSISQYAALAAVTGGMECVEEMLGEFARRREYVAQRLNDIPGLSARLPDGAFYFFINIREYMGRTIGGLQIKDSVDFATACLEGAHVAFVPGLAFGTDGYVRMSFAAAQSELEKGLDALHNWLKTAE